LVGYYSIGFINGVEILTGLFCIGDKKASELWKDTWQLHQGVVFLLCAITVLIATLP
jgi:hypothetical protein